MSLATNIKKIFSFRSIQDSRLQNQMDTTLEEFRGEGEKEKGEKEMKGGIGGGVRGRVAEMEGRKRELLGRVGAIVEELGAERAGEDSEKKEELRNRIKAILKGHTLN